MVQSLVNDNKWAIMNAKSK